MAEKCINYMSACPIPPHTNPMELGSENTFNSKSKKTKRFMIFNPKKWGGVYISTFLTPPPPSKAQKSVFQVGGGSGGGSGPKTHWGMRLLDTIMILQQQFNPLG